jgi:hypothetical protein
MLWKKDVLTSAKGRGRLRPRIRFVLKECGDEAVPTPDGLQTLPSGPGLVTVTRDEQALLLDHGD